MNRLKSEIEEYMPRSEQERQDKKVIQDAMRTFPGSVLTRGNELVHFTASGLILNRSLDKVLLVHHNVMDKWAWTGGHADGDARLCDVALREAEEETGVAVSAISRRIASLDVLTVQGHVRRGKYVNGHVHLSAAYVFMADERQTPTVKPDENSGVRWFPVEYICGDTMSPRDVYLYTKLIRQAGVWLGRAAEQ